MKTVSLPPATAADYELVNWVGSHKQDFGTFGVIDVSTLTPAQAEKLVQRGWKKLRRKSAAAPIKK